MFKNYYILKLETPYFLPQKYFEAMELCLLRENAAEWLEEGEFTFILIKLLTKQQP